jgi:hypothetical protein
MKTRPYAWLWIGGGLAGIAGVLALGVSPTLLIVGASVLACPITMALSIRAMCRPQDTKPDDSHHKVVPELQDTAPAPNAN